MPGDWAEILTNDGYYARVQVGAWQHVKRNRLLRVYWVNGGGDYCTDVIREDRIRSICYYHD